MIQHSSWYYHIYLVSTLIFAGVVTGYSAMMSWVFDSSFNQDKYTAGFCLITVLSGILIIAAAVSLVHFFRLPDPNTKISRAFIIVALTLHIAIVIIAIVMLGILGPKSTMAFYVVLVLWAAINGALAVLSLLRSPTQVHKERQHNHPQVPNMTIRSEEIVFAQQQQYQ